MTPEAAARILDRAAAWLSARARTPGYLPFTIDVDPQAEQVRLQAWTPSPIDENLSILPDPDSYEIARLLLAPGRALQLADHGARSLLVGRGRLDAAWLARRRPHLSLPVVALTLEDRAALAAWLAQVEPPPAPMMLQDGTAHERLCRSTLPPLPADLEARVRARFPRLVLVPGERVRALVHLPDAAAPRILSLA